MNSDLSMMSKEELRQYVIQHPNDKEAFYFYVDSLKSSSSSSQVYPSSLSPEEIEKVIAAYNKYQSRIP